MPGAPVFVDTFFVLALLNRRDVHHDPAKSLLPYVAASPEVVITEAILTEIGNALRNLNRRAAVEYIRGCYRIPNFTVIEVTSALFQRGVDLYDARPDKDWSLTDCISFVVMQDRGIREAATGDHHFEQAGFRKLL